MPTWLLYFFAGAGAVALLAILMSCYNFTKKDRKDRDLELSIKNLRRECVMLERLCDATRVVTNKQMEAITELAGIVKLMDNNLIELNKKMYWVWGVAKDWKVDANPKETGPDG